MEESYKERRFISKAQRNTLIAFTKDHEELASGRFTNDFTRAKADAMWGDSTNILNAIPGASRNVLQWRNTWKVFKKNMKYTAAESKKYAQGTGGGPHTSNVNSEDECILSIIKPTSAFGIEDIADNVPFSFEDMKGTSQNEIITIVHEDVRQKLEENVKDGHIPTVEIEDVATNKVNLKPKRLKRRKGAIDVSQDYVNIANERSQNMNMYYREKLNLVRENQQRRQAYEEKKLNIMQNVLLKFKEIKTLSIRKDKK